MEPEFEIIEKEIGNVIEVEEKVPMWKMPFIMGKDFNRILEYLKSRNCECVEAPYARYLNVDWEAQMKKSAIANFISIFMKWHFKVGMPTSEKLDGEGDLISGITENRKYVKSLHRGPYQKVGQTYKKMYEWIKNQGLDIENESVEMYLNDPGETKKEDLETIVLIPLK